MEYKGLYIFVEGSDDERFFRKIIEPELRKRYSSIKIVQYAQMSKDKKKSFIKSIQSIRADYIYVTDINDEPCVTAKKQKVQKELKNIDSDKIVVLIKEIESWYVAGLSDSVIRKFKIKNLNTVTTDDIDKEKFEKLIPKRFDSRIDFMIEILKNFSIKVAAQKNRSFNYFIKKYILS